MTLTNHWPGTIASELTEKFYLTAYSLSDESLALEIDNEASGGFRPTANKPYQGCVITIREERRIASYHLYDYYYIPKDMPTEHEHDGDNGYHVAPKGCRFVTVSVKAPGDDGFKFARVFLVGHSDYSDEEAYFRALNRIMGEI
jgi:hypothetical protein